jgi:hypothetical protein
VVVTRLVALMIVTAGQPAVLVEHEPVAIVLGASAQTPAPAATTRVLMPVDEAASVPDFFSFRAQLIAAVARRDVTALMSVVDPDIKNGFGGDNDNGKAAFERYWRPAAADSMVWEVLATVLALGGGRAGEDAFEAPYVSSAWPTGVDGFEHIAVIGERVRVRKAPSPDAAELSQVSFEVLSRGRDGRVPDGWTSVTLADGRSGYIHSRFVRSPVDYRAYFARKDGRWRMVMLLAGD